VATTIKRSEHENTDAHRALVARQQREISDASDRQKREREALDERHATARSQGRRRYGARTQGPDEARRKHERKRLFETHQEELKILKCGHARESEAMRRRHEREAAK
jgi:hypothetical protein